MSYWINRTICGVLEDMRALDKTKNYGPLLSLIEELQMMGNKMEAAIGDKNDVKRMVKDRDKLKKQIRELKDKLPDKGEEYE